MKIYHRKQFAAALVELALAAAGFVTLGLTGFDGKLLVLGVLLLLFGVGSLTVSRSREGAVRAYHEETDERNRLLALQSKARVYDILTGCLFALTLLSLIGAAVTEEMGFVYTLLISAVLLGVAWFGRVITAVYFEKRG